MEKIKSFRFVIWVILIAALLTLGIFASEYQKKQNKVIDSYSTESNQIEIIFDDERERYDVFLIEEQKHAYVDLDHVTVIYVIAEQSVIVFEKYKNSAYNRLIIYKSINV